METKSLRPRTLTLAGATLCAVGALLGGTAQAGTVFTDEASFVAAASAVSLPLPSSDSGDFSISGFSFTASAATFSSFVIDTAVYGTAIPGEAGGANLLLNSTELFSVAAPTPIYAFGFAIYRPSNPNPIPGDPRGPVSCNFTCGTDPFTVSLYEGATLVELVLLHAGPGHNRVPRLLGQFAVRLRANHRGRLIPREHRRRIFRPFQLWDHGGCSRAVDLGDAVGRFRRSWLRGLQADEEDAGLRRRFLGRAGREMRRGRLRGRARFSADRPGDAVVAYSGSAPIASSAARAHSMSWE